ARRRSCATSSSAGAACRATTRRGRRSMREQFYALAARLEKALEAGETLLCNVSAERSDFVRFNKALVREQRQASATIALAGNGEDVALASGTLERLRDALGDLPVDPWLLINEKPRS